MQEAANHEKGGFLSGMKQYDQYSFGGRVMLRMRLR